MREYNVSDDNDNNNDIVDIIVIYFLFVCLLFNIFKRRHTKIVTDVKINVTISNILSKSCDSCQKIINSAKILLIK